MKILASAALVSCLVLACARCAFAADAKGNAADYPLAVHVSASAYAPTSNLYQTLTAAIGNMHYQLLGLTCGSKLCSHASGLINPGDYHAKLIQDEHKTSYESLQQFEILFPDGSTRRFDVIAQAE